MSGSIRSKKKCFNYLNMSQPAVSRKKIPKNKSDDEKSEDEKSDSSANKKSNFRYGPLPKSQRVWSRGVVVLGIVIYLWWFSSRGPKEVLLAKQSEIYSARGQQVDCSQDYLDDVKQYKNCVPNKCGRYVSDMIVSFYEADLLLKLAKKVMAGGGSFGGATIMDLHSGALSYKDKFINIYKKSNINDVLTSSDIAIYSTIRTRIQKAIADSFALDKDSLHLTHPTFFSRLTSADPKSEHDEYWHLHIDKITYESFHYTSLLYLNDFGTDFRGGRFVFTDDFSSPKKNTTVEPRKGRVLMFTSGSENPHFVERVSEGMRFAITVSFTCDKSKAIQDPKPTSSDE